jgi:hypothetical protein
MPIHQIPYGNGSFEEDQEDPGSMTPAQLSAKCKHIQKQIEIDMQYLALEKSELERAKDQRKREYWRNHIALIEEQRTIEREGNHFS